MVQNQEQPVGKITFSILIALSLSHCLNDLLQSVLSASYPLFKDDLGLSFAQIGLITLVYQLSASVFQPITGIFFDKHPVAWSLPIGMSFTLIGLINLAFSDNLYWILASVFLIGIGSSVLHPEASRITFLASGGKRGLAQSLFQVGGNFGGSLGPLLVALLVAPYGRQHLIVFAFVALAAIGVMYPICKWYRSYLNRMKEQTVSIRKPVHLPLPMDKTALSIGILLILIFSKYIYMASLTSYYTFYLIHKFNVSVQDSQLYLFIFLVATAIGVMYPICKWYKSYLNRMKAQTVSVRKPVHLPLPMDKTALSIAILLILIFSKYIYMASLTSYYTFYLIHKFNVSVQDSQLYLFIFLVATAIGTLIGGPVGDRIGRKYVIWASILGAAPFSLLMPHANLLWTIILSFCVGLMLSSAFPAILLYAQELLPTKLGLISGLFFGFAFGVAGVASAVLGNLADKTSIEYVYNICAYMPLLGLVTFFLPNLKKKKIE